MADFARSADPAVQAQLDRLTMVSTAGDRLGLERIAELCDRLGRPQDRLPPVFHVAGTNGKGSTCAFLTAALEAAGHSVHVFTSPHLVRFNERIRVAGTLIDDSTLAALLAEVIDAGEGIDPSFFEVSTAAAFLAFARTPADACVLEVGLGGRLDATNVIERPLVCGIAGIAADHQQFLGKKLGGIAAEKAGIAKRGVPLVTQLYPPAVSHPIWQAAKDAGAIWLPRGGEWDARVSRGKIAYRDSTGALDLPLPTLPGKHQAMNAALAVAMIRHQATIDVPVMALSAAMSSARWPARMQRLGPGPVTDMVPEGSETWVDGGHNPAASRAIADHLQSRFTDDLPLVLLFASLTSKDARGSLAPFRGLASNVLTLPIDGHDSRDPNDLAAMARSMGMRAQPFEALGEALAAVRQPARFLVFGSLYLAGQALAANGEIPN